VTAEVYDTRIRACLAKFKPKRLLEGVEVGWEVMMRIGETARVYCIEPDSRWPIKYEEMDGCQWSCDYDGIEDPMMNTGKYDIVKVLGKHHE